MQRPIWRCGRRPSAARRPAHSGCATPRWRPRPARGEYPAEQYLLPEAEGRRWLKVDYHCRYSLQTLILLFFTFSFIGWVWEVSLHLFGSGVFVNRGVLHGPWLPIYGTAACFCWCC